MPIARGNRWAWYVLLAMLAPAGACSKCGPKPPKVVSVKRTIAVGAASFTIFFPGGGPAPSSTTITATVTEVTLYDNGSQTFKVVPGAAVTLVPDVTNCGTLSNTSLTTAGNGEARTTYTAKPVTSDCWVTIMAVTADPNDGDVTNICRVRTKPQ
jgi:hypothetical protein